MQAAPLSQTQLSKRQHLPIAQNMKPTAFEGTALHKPSIVEAVMDEDRCSSHSTALLNLPGTTYQIETEHASEQETCAMTSSHVHERKYEPGHIPGDDISTSLSALQAYATDHFSNE